MYTRWNAVQCSVDSEGVHGVDQDGLPSKFLVLFSLPHIQCSTNTAN